MAYEIGSRIRRYREAKDMTQKQLAELVGVTNSRISNYENGLNRPDCELLTDICRALAVSPSDLLDFHLNDEISQHEREVLNAYRSRANMQHAVDVLLGIDGSASKW